MPASSTLWIVLGSVALVALVYRTLFNPSLSRKVARAVSSGDIAPVRAALEASPQARQPVAYDSAIQTLWNDYERELAVPLIRDFALAHPEERVAQYWLDQLQRVEPELAREQLGREFMAEHFRPDVAAQCGRFG